MVALKDVYSAPNHLNPVMRWSPHPKFFLINKNSTLYVLCVTQYFAYACAGCSTAAVAPAEGDVRLVPINNTAISTAACDAVHLGAVEMFRAGRWGRICSGRRGGEFEKFTLDAQVICRQLGFPFGNVMDVGEIFGAYEEDYTVEVPVPLVWASEVRSLFYVASAMSDACSSNLKAITASLHSTMTFAWHCLRCFIEQLPPANVYE